MAIDFSRVCPNCFREGMSQGKCSICGYDESTAKKNAFQLTPFTILADRYLIGRVLGSGGFGITYKAYDTLNNIICAIKEFVPSGIAMRSAVNHRTLSSVKGQIENFEHGKKRFLDEARVLKKLNNIEEVVRITDYFSQNNTVYFVMEYLQGATLRNLTSTMGGRIPVSEAIPIIYKVGNALDQVHRRENIFHRDISPENIMVTPDGSIRIIDFGSAKYLTSQKSQNMTVVLKHGFAPPEQYSSSGKQGSYTDVYALAATMYYIISGCMPSTAPDRLSGENYVKLKDMDTGIDESISDAVDRALELNYRTRTQTVSAFIRAFRPARSEDLSESSRSAKEKGAYVEVISEVMKSTRWTIPADKTMKVGRSDTSDILLQGNTQISKLHCEIQYSRTKNQFYITDRSKNGTYLDGNRLKKNKTYAVNPGKQLVLGNWIYKLKVGVA